MKKSIILYYFLALIFNLLLLNKIEASAEVSGNRNSVFGEFKDSGETQKKFEDKGIQSISDQNFNAIQIPPQMKVRMAMHPAKQQSFELEGYLSKRINRSIQRYLLVTHESSPAILQIFRDRDRVPFRKGLVGCAGESAGKYLTGAELMWRLTHNKELKETIDSFVIELIKCQEPDGYLGPYPKNVRLTGDNADAWGHYHCMLGLMLYYEDSHYEPALTACKKIADLLCENFGKGKPSLTCDKVGGQMNMAISHGLILLYEKTGITRYLDLANYVVNKEWNESGAGKFVNSTLAGKTINGYSPYRWEMIHTWQALNELYWLTGDEKYRNTVDKIWHSVADGDRHNTGGITSGEGFIGSSYKTGPIETCCTVAWTAFSLDLLRMTGNSQVADEIEWSTFNSALGAIPYSGRTCAYNVPMDGTRTFGVELWWQSPLAGPDLNCCAVNANRPLGLISQWALMQSAEGPVVNFYGPGKMTSTLPSDNKLTIKELTEYPADGFVKLVLDMEKREAFTLKLRIPMWSTDTDIRVNGKAIAGKVVPGTYLEINREWKSGDTIELTLDFKLRFWYGKEECQGKVSIYRGPILLTCDARFNEKDQERLPKLDIPSLKFESQRFNDKLEPWVFGVLKDKNGASITVCDFSSAGQTGNQYHSWVPFFE